MIQIILVLLSMSFHKACLRYVEGDTARKTHQIIVEHIVDKHLFEINWYTDHLIKEYLIDEYYLRQIKSNLLTSSSVYIRNRDTIVLPMPEYISMPDSLWRHFLRHAERSVIWWKLTRKQHGISFHEACVRRVAGDSSYGVYRRLRRYEKHHSRKISKIADRLLHEWYKDQLSFEWESSTIEDRRRHMGILDEVNREACMILWLREARKNNYPNPWF